MVFRRVDNLGLVRFAPSMTFMTFVYAIAAAVVIGVVVGLCQIVGDFWNVFFGDDEPENQEEP